MHWRFYVDIANDITSSVGVVFIDIEDDHASIVVVVVDFCLFVCCFVLHSILACANNGVFM